MRARRLRRLGLSGGGAAPSQSTECAVADAMESTERGDQAMDNVSSSQESSTSEQRQKQQKFDNDATMQEESGGGGLNNNESAGKASTKQQRSRLLDEIEKQRFENTLNQNVESIAQTMETDENVQSTVVDSRPSECDSGIENMETDDVTTVVATPATTAVDDAMAIQNEIEACLSRILDAFWSEQCEGQIIVSETADSYKDFVDPNTDAINYEELAFQIIGEIIAQYFDGKRVDFKSSHSSTAPVDTDTHRHSSKPTAYVKPRRKAIASTSTGDVNRMDTDDANCSAPNLLPHNLPEHGACTYLIQAYQRSDREYERYNMAKNQKKFGISVLTMIFAVKEQLVRSAVLLLNGAFVSRTTSKSYRSVLLDMLYDDTLPFEFLRHLVVEASRNGNDVGKTFTLLLNNLFTDMQSRVVGKEINMAPINVLSQLLDISINGPTGTAYRPFCNLVAKLLNFCPQLCTDTQGREIVKVSYLGPFQSLSVFSEENPKLFEDVDEDFENHLGLTLQAVSSARAAGGGVALPMTFQLIFNLVSFSNWK